MVFFELCSMFRTAMEYVNGYKTQQIEQHFDANVLC